MGTYSKIVTIQVEQTFEDEHDTIIQQRVIDGNIELAPIVEKKYIIGIRNRTGVENKYPEAFIVKSANFKEDDNDFENVLYKEIICTFSKAVAISKDILKKYKEEEALRKEQLQEKIRQRMVEGNDFRKGEVIIYVDEGEKEHFAIIIRPGQNVSKMLFVTSTQTWNDRSRRMTKEERILTGMAFRCPISFFAPVVRPNVYANKVGNCYPKHRVEELEQEFFPRG